jgi:hypothetical protein
VKKISFGLLELEMADLERFWRKTPLGPLGVKHERVKKFKRCVMPSSFFQACPSKYLI